MMSRRTTLLVLVTGLACACLYQETQANRPFKDMLEKTSQRLKERSQPEPEEAAQAAEAAEASPKWNPFEPYQGKEPEPQKTEEQKTDGPKIDPAAQDILFNPLKFVLRIIGIITYPPRFIIRFFFTFAATFFLVLFNCQVIPEVKCVVPVREMIPGILEGLKEELDFYASMGKH